MGRLITFGDSFTYGHGLEDCHIPAKKVFLGSKEQDAPGPSPSKYAWPQLLGDLLGLEVINKSVPGNSNLQVLRDILSFDGFEPLDLVIVGWSFKERDTIFNKNLLGQESETRISPWHKSTKILKQYLNVHNGHDMAVRMGLHIHHAECYLKTCGVEQLHFCAFHHAWYNDLAVFIRQPDYFTEEPILIHTDKALDGSHPGPVTHIRGAKKLYDILTATK
jgi:hypothetical protein